ncbi:hypothetical protein GGS23DRAFT_234388 [Durotheca rogersii]|uniref:uncharacterized protein n=1 Tax=Durotheca rogersii TaxID=419775 RepID=UPI00221F4DCC|nr:uncharacterized protein GGS23DRAFT_234388 [Durotheca rogersii]KAI5860365.1 hypothetical protein GGS23DRAFT_234388 [Durotheca rogersii]
MGKPWSFSSWIRLAGWALLARTSVAAHDNRHQARQLEKDYQLFRHPKREASCQQENWTLCPVSAEGGCCPQGYACAASFCYTTTAGPTTACGQEGYYNCPLSAGAGTCCPVGWTCLPDRCQPPLGVEYPANCPASYSACASSLGGGCCPATMACGMRSCYHTDPTTQVVSARVTTTNSDGDQITVITSITSVFTEGPNPSDSSAAPAGVPKVVATTIAKLPAIETGELSGGGDGGLTPGQLGGIISGVVVLLIVVIVAAVLIIRRLKQTELAAQAAVESRHESSSGQQPSQKSAFGQTTISEIDGTDVDSIARTGHYRARSESSNGTQSRSETPNFYGPNGPSTPPPAWPLYASELPPSHGFDGRQSSQDSYPFAQRTSVDSDRTRTHGRKWSIGNASEVSGSADGNHGRSELDSNADSAEAARRRSGSIGGWSKGHARWTSDASSASRTRGEGPPPPLGTVNEVSEIHGYYGPSNRIVQGDRGDGEQQ